MNTPRLSLWFILVLGFLVLPLDSLRSQIPPQQLTGDPKVIPVGKGSYAEFPPGSDKEVEKMLTRPLFVDISQNGKPIPTNHAWTYLINNPSSSKPGGKVWAYPLTMEADKAGANVYYPTEWKGNDMETGPGIAVSADGFTPGDACVLNWGDWSMVLQYKQDDAHLMNITVVRGEPYVWYEFKGIQPTLSLGHSGGKGGGAVDAVLEDDKGQPLNLPVSSNHIIVSQGDRLFVVYAPDGSTFDGKGNDLKVTNGQSPVSFLVVAALPSLDQLDLLTSCAYAIPRNTTYGWSYDPVKGEVQTTWNIDADALQGSNKNVIQGWLPHHYRTTRQDLKFTPLQYKVVRGLMKTTVGQSFSIAWSFNGIPPMLPAPTAVAEQANPFQEDRMKYYLDGYINEKLKGKDGSPKEGKARYGADTYWGGKSLTQFGLYADMATEVGETDDAKVLSDALRDAMSDWFTYTPGETANYFARYDRWKALLGFKGSFGSLGFVDNHLHYGYFTMATALMGLHDPQFLKDYGPMARLVAKQYGNWDRNDPDFPLFRTFDPWAGRSYCSGSGSENGGNQESSSECMQGWTGLFLLGVELQDKDMTAAGAMGWAVEESAIEEYWFNYYGWKNPADSNFPASYAHAINCNAYDAGYAFGTFFGGQPLYVYGIQWLPLQPGLYYFGRDPKFAHYQIDSLFQDMQTKPDAKNPIKTMDDLGIKSTDWGEVVLGYLQFGDPQEVVADLDKYWDAKNSLATGLNTAGITYYFAHSDRGLGPVAWDYHSDLPASLVYQKPGDKSVTLVAWNASEAPVDCQVYHNGQVVGKVSVPSRKLSTFSVPVTAVAAP